MAHVTFNTEQQKAIRHTTGPMLVLAGPGSGKTTVLVQRILHLVNVCGENPEALLVITFTRAAAQEMEARYRAAGGRIGVTFGTFHSVFFRILCEQDGYRAENIASQEQCFQLLRGVLQVSYPQLRLTTDLTLQLLGAISRYKNTGHVLNCPIDKTHFMEIRERYAARMRENRLLDFDDMLLLLLERLRNDRRLLTSLRMRFSHIMVDEFQDVNQTQYELVHLLAMPRKNLFAVGDDDQSIYGFRGSDPVFMRRILEDFAPCREVLLGTNYRSSGRIVEASLALINHNRTRFKKDLRAAAAYGEAAAVSVMRFRDEHEEAAAIVKALRRSLQEGKRLSSTAVLYRKNNIAGVLSEQLSLAGISVASAGNEKDGVRLMTFHGSKGLEFEEVYIIGANEGITPSAQAYTPALLEEERRMFYVAMTRAKRKLHIFVTDRSYNKPQKPSSFLKELIKQ